MSKKVKASIQCLNCGHKQNMVLFRSIWAEDPENRALLLSDQVNVFYCNKCKHKERLDYPLLCTNVKKQIALWYEPYHDEQIDKDAEQYAAHMGPNSFYAKAPRIADWEEFKNAFLKMDAAGPQPGREVKPSPESKSLFRGFLASLRGDKPDREKSQAAPPPQSINDVMEAYGKLLETYPSSIIDVAALPLSKAEMKIVLKTLYGREIDPRRKEWIAVGFMLLSNFQDGVGAVPIDGRLPVANGDPMAKLQALKAHLDRWTPWNNLAAAEGEILEAEWERFKQGERP